MRTGFILATPAAASPGAASLPAEIERRSIYRSRRSSSPSSRCLRRQPSVHPPIGAHRRHGEICLDRSTTSAWPDHPPLMVSKGQRVVFEGDQRDHDGPPDAPPRSPFPGHLRSTTSRSTGTLRDTILVLPKRKGHASPSTPTIPASGRSTATISTTWKPACSPRSPMTASCERTPRHPPPPSAADCHPRESGDPVTESQNPHGRSLLGIRPRGCASDALVRDDRSPTAILPDPLTCSTRAPRRSLVPCPPPCPSSISPTPLPSPGMSVPRPAMSASST